MLMNKVCLPASRAGGKKNPANYLSCVIKEAELERRLEVGEQWRLQRAGGRRQGEEKHCSLTSTALQQRNKAKQEEGLLIHRGGSAVFIPFRAAQHGAPPAAESLLVWHFGTARST